jgi:hypothetical protein
LACKKRFQSPQIDESEQAKYTRARKGNWKMEKTSRKLWHVLRTNLKGVSQKKKKKRKKKIRRALHVGWDGKEGLMKQELKKFQARKEKTKKKKRKRKEKVEKRNYTKRAKNEKRRRSRRGRGYKKKTKEKKKKQKAKRNRGEGNFKKKKEIGKSFRLLKEARQERENL